MVPMTAAQRATLAKLRINHPRADVTLLHRQEDLPLVRVKMRWRKTTFIRWIWIAPDGRRERSVPGGGRRWPNGTGGTR